MTCRNGLLVVAMVVAVVAGCGGGDGGSDSAEADVDPSGIWLGTQSIVNDGAYDMKTLIHGGRLYGISEGANAMFAGTYEIHNGKFLVSNGHEASDTVYKLYDATTGVAVSRGIVSVRVTEKSSFAGTFANDLSQEGEVRSSYSGLSARPASLAYFKGPLRSDKIDLAVGSDGVLAGALRDCALTGTVEVPDPVLNLYKLSYALEGCADAGRYDGLGVIALDEAQAPYFFALAANEARMESFGSHLDDPPAELFAAYGADPAGKARGAARRAAAARAVADNVATLLAAGNCEHCDLAGADLSGRDLSGMALTGADLTGANLSDATLTDAVLDDATLTGADLRGATLRSTRFTGANLRQADLRGAKSFTMETETDCHYTGLFGPNNYICSEVVHPRIGRTDFSYADLSATDLSGARIPLAQFRNAVLVETNLSAANIAGASFANALLQDVYAKDVWLDLSTPDTPDTPSDPRFSFDPYAAVGFRGTTLQGVDFSGGFLPRSDFRQAALDQVNFSGASLVSSNFRQAALDQVNFSGASLVSSDFREATFHRVNFSDVDADRADFGNGTPIGFDFDWLRLAGARFEELDLRGHDFSEVRLGSSILNSNLTDAKFIGAHVTGSLTGSILARADFSGASFDGAGLRDVDARRADFSSATILASELSGANFVGANLKGVVFAQVTRSFYTERNRISDADFTYANLEGATFDFFYYDDHDSDETKSVEGIATFSCAWWKDGSRCGALPAPFDCSPCLFGCDLTYEEYLAGRRDPDEELLQDIGETVEAGEKFFGNLKEEVTDVGGSVRSTISRWF